MIKKRYLVPYQEGLFCDDCGTEMQLSNKIIMTDPPQYEHFYPKCEKSVVMDEVFPNIKYEENTACSDIFQNNIFTRF